MTTFTTPTTWQSARWWRNRSLDERYFHAKVPPRHATTAPVLGTTPQAKWVENYRRGDSLLITGPSGAGKTAAAITSMNSLLQADTVSGRFVDADDYIEMIKDSFNSSDGNLSAEYSTPYLLKYIKGVWDIVIIDALGNERQTEFARHEIGSLIRHRYDHKLTTIITSTMSLTDLLSTYGDRVKSAVIDMKQITLKVSP